VSRLETWTGSIALLGRLTSRRLTLRLTVEDHVGIHKENEGLQKVVVATAVGRPLISNRHDTQFLNDSRVIK